MAAYQYITLRQQPRLMEPAARWFHSKWGVPTEAYLECMEAYLKGETELGWYLCLEGESIVGGLGAIENDFHDRKDLSPNICAVYTEESYRCRGIAGSLLNMAVRVAAAAFLVLQMHLEIEALPWSYAAGWFAMLAYEVPALVKFLKSDEL